VTSFKNIHQNEGLEERENQQQQTPQQQQQQQKRDNFYLCLRLDLDFKGHHLCHVMFYFRYELSLNKKGGRKLRPKHIISTNQSGHLSLGIHGYEVDKPFYHY